MSSSLLTNTAAMTALKTLRSIGNDLDKAQNRVSTGRRINEAADNTAYWAISNNMQSDSKTIGVIKDALHLGKARVDQAYTSNQQVKKELQSIKELIASASGLSADDQEKIAQTIKTKLENIKTAVESGVMDGTNFLLQNGEATTTFDIPASFRRKGSAVTVDTISLKASDLNLIGVSGSGDEQVMDTSQGMLKDIFASDFFTHKKSSGVLVQNHDHGKHHNKPEPSPDPAPAFARLTKKDIEDFSEKVQHALDCVANVDTVLGAAKEQVDSQYEFVNNIVDNLDKSVGTLVDADMNAESARLSALQVQQQLAVQALSIANQSSQSLLSLFRQ